MSYQVSFLCKYSICVAVAWACLVSTVWGKEISPPGKWILGIQGGVSMMTQDIGNGNGAITEGAEGLILNERLLYRITDSVALGIHIESEEHVIRNINPVPLTFGRSRTVSSMVAVEFYPPLWPTFADALSQYPLFPYGLIGVGQNRNSFTESSTFSNNCNPNSACKIDLENTLAVKVALGVDYFVMPDLSINAEVGWKLNSGASRISTTNSEGGLITSNDGYEASAGSFVVGMRYFFEKPKRRPPVPIAPPQEKPVPKQVPIIKPVQDTQWVTKALFFESSSWEISDDGKALLLDIAADLNGSPQTPIQIEGHTDLHGSKEGNVKIAQKRAEAVAELLTEAGVINEIKIISYGDSQPVSMDETPDADRLNRRVIIRRLESVKE